MFVLWRQNSLLGTLKCLMKAVVAILMIFAIEESLAILIVPPVWKREEGQKKVRMKLTDKQKLEMKMLHFAQSELQSISWSGLIANVSGLYPETAEDDGLGLLVYFNRLEQQGFLVIFISKTSIFLFLINIKLTWHIVIVLMKFEVWYPERGIRETRITEQIL